MLRKERTEVEMTLLPDYGRKKLLGYADTFRDLARTFTYIPEEIPAIQNEKEEITIAEQDAPSKQDIITKKRLLENREIIADHLQEMAQIMVHVAEESFRPVYISNKTQKQIVQILKSHGIAVQTIYMMEHGSGQIELSLRMKAIRSRHFETAEVAGLLSVILNRRLIPNKNTLSYLTSDMDIYIFEEEAIYTVFTGVAKAVKENEQMSGDNYSFTELDNGHMVCAISDGMGSGEKACRDSGMVVDLLEKLLEAGFERHTAVQMINGSLITCEEEQNMSTLDICEIDLRTGSSIFLKIGAAPSFIKRQQVVDIMAADNLPLGIFHQLSVNETECLLQEGDYVIMISDGVLDAFQNEDALYLLQEFINRIELENPSEIANHVLQFAIHACGGKIRDDMTVVTAGMWKSGKY